MLEIRLVSTKLLLLAIREFNNESLQHLNKKWQRSCENIALKYARKDDVNVLRETYGWCRRHKNRHHRGSRTVSDPDIGFPRRRNLPHLRNSGEKNCPVQGASTNNSKERCRPTTTHRPATLTIGRGRVPRQVGEGRRWRQPQNCSKLRHLVRRSKRATSPSYNDQ